MRRLRHAGDDRFCNPNREVKPLLHQGSRMSGFGVQAVMLGRRDEVEF